MKPSHSAWTRARVGVTITFIATLLLLAGCATPPAPPSVYVASGKTVYALDPQTGALRWKYQVTVPQQPEIFAFIVRIWHADNTVFVSYGYGWLLALSDTAGTLRWKFRQPSSNPLDSSQLDRFAASSEVVYVGPHEVGGGSAPIYAISLATGKVLWQRQGSARLFANADAVYFAAAPSHAITAFRAADGAILWSVTNYSIQELVGSTLYGISANSAIGFNAQTGAIEWSQYYDETPYQTLPVGDTLYSTSGSTLAALDMKTNTFRWRTSLGGSPYSHFSYSDGRLCTSRGVALIGIDAATGKQTWMLLPGGDIAGELIANGTVCVAEAVNSSPAGSSVRLCVVDMSTGQLRWSVPNYDYAQYVVWRSMVFRQVFSPATVPDHVVPGLLQALSVADGTVQWSFDPHGSAGILVS